MKWTYFKFTHADVTVFVCVEEFEGVEQLLAADAVLKQLLPVVNQLLYL